MKRIILAISLFAANAAFCQEITVNDNHAQERHVGAFHAVEVSGGIDLYISQGNKETVAASASSPDLRDRIVTEVENGVLKIHIDNSNGHKWNWGNQQLKVYVAFANLDVLRASGGSDVYVTGTLTLSKLNMVFSGGSDFRGRVDVRDISIECGGGSDVYISGRAANLEVSSSGGSDYHGFELIAENCRVNASGGSDASLFVNKELNATASGGSDIYYKGTCVIKNLSSSGGSDIKFKG